MTTVIDAHGLMHNYAAYVNRKCRCTVCVEDHRAHIAEVRQKRRAERVLVGARLVHPRAKHGLCSSYQNYGCRCEPCTAAASSDKHRWRTP